MHLDIVQIQQQDDCTHEYILTEIKQEKIFASI